MLLTRWLHRLFGGLAALIFLVLIAVVSLQVFTRIALPTSPDWTEELARYCLLYLTACGVGLAWRSGELVNVDLLVNLLSARGRRHVEAFTTLVVVAISVGLLPAAWRLVQIGQFQTSPSLGWPMAYVNFSIVLLLAGLALFGIAHIWSLLRPGRRKAG